ncbi:MAG: uroporphyrinogen-III synthase [Gammaproteobacteria bacterium]|nr:uroporphyrinogen-III synthase [Gammaproteobacteria bacterium]MYB36595.1 uroporphyrinogen-III synthase [Gammaproteobacteria bacterium]
MRVWVTRTEPGASRMAATLEGAGIACLVAPVLNIVPTGQPLPGGSYDLALFVSEHAATLAAAEPADWSAEVVAGIGEPALAALAERCPQATHARVVAATDADCVLRMLDGWPEPPRRTLIAKGQGGRDDVQRHLREAGGAVVEWDAYRRVAAAPAVVPAAVSAIVCSSGEGVRAAGALWFAERGRPDVPVFVPSARAQTVASETGFQTVRVTAGAAPKAVVAAMNALKERNV